MSLVFGWTDSYKITEEPALLACIGLCIGLGSSCIHTPGLDRRMILNVWVRRGRGEAVSRVRGPVNQSNPLVIECEEPEERPWV